jgi:hypothetical protein
MRGECFAPDRHLVRRGELSLSTDIGAKVDEE